MKSRDEELTKAASEYIRGRDADCFCSRTEPGTPVGKHSYFFCGCDLDNAFRTGANWQRDQGAELMRAYQDLELSMYLKDAKKVSLALTNILKLRDGV